VDAREEATMEKIQDAIAKAREARLAAGADAETPSRPVTPAVGMPVAPAAQPQTGEDRWLALPEFVPNLRRLKRNRIMTLVGGREAMDFDVIRTRLLQQMRANNWTRVAVTSPTQGCGKSTMVANLAFSLARQREQRTIVAEMDMRRPSLARSLGISERLNLSHVLDARDRFENNAVRVKDNLIFSTNSEPVRASSELLQSDTAITAVGEIQAAYLPTVMLFDTPPMLSGDDTMAFLNQVDCVLLIAAAEATTIKQIDSCERDIASQTNVLGVVLNKCRYPDRDTTYGYYE
jgi:Mrp family chromosome partitioning ATPase